MVLLGSKHNNRCMRNAHKRSYGCGRSREVSYRSFITGRHLSRTLEYILPRSNMIWVNRVLNGLQWATNTGDSHSLSNTQTICPLGLYSTNFTHKIFLLSSKSLYENISIPANMLRFILSLRTSREFKLEIHSIIHRWHVGVWKNICGGNALRQSKHRQRSDQDFSVYVNRLHH